MPEITGFSLTVFDNLFRGIAEEMGSALARSAFSPNIRERLDFSCALFDGKGRLLAQAAHIPVHLGSMPELVRQLAEREWKPGDLIAANDPFSGGTHLPDITLVSPCFAAGRLLGFAAARAHHADVGGMSPGSMPMSNEIYQEGLILPPVYLAREGKRQQDIWSVILANVRTPEEREGDLLAQLAACRCAEKRVAALVERYRLEQVLAHQNALLDYAEKRTRAALAELPDGRGQAEDRLEWEPQNPLIKVSVELNREGATIDFGGSDPAVPGCVNATFPVTCAAVYYVFRCLLGDDIPANQGAFRPLKIKAPAGSVVHAQRPAAVVAGNVETSQRIVDVLLKALAQVLPDRIPACSAGTMNNLAVGGSWKGRSFAYYETMGGGCGAGPDGDGEHGFQVHMTNTRNTPAEALESEIPIRVRRYQLRGGSGGEGKHRGGDGIRRDLEFLAEVKATLLAQRRASGPPGAAGGEAGQPGQDFLIRDGREVPLPGQFQREFQAGDVLSLRTPGGGGWGAPKAQTGDGGRETGEKEF